MRKARPLGLSPDGSVLIVVAENGEQLAVPADERLRAALRDDRPRLGQLEIDMDSSLRPREIQSRIRAGESADDVARAAGVPVERIEGFAAPVIAEREHIAGLAQTSPVRRAGESVAHRPLRTVVTERLLSRGVDIDSATWDAWLLGERRWMVQLSYESGSAHREAQFTYDQTGRFSVATNDDARWLLGEQSSSHGPQPGRRPRRDPDDEATLDLNDELALIRAIQPDIDDERADNEDAYAEAELAEVDGVYDFVPAEKSDIDVLYDMLSSFDEDSVQIYAGLVRAPADEGRANPVVVDSAEDDEAEAPAAQPAPEPAAPTKRTWRPARRGDQGTARADAPAGPPVARQPEPPAREPDRAPQAEPTDRRPEPERESTRPETVQITVPEQPSLVDETPNQPEAQPEPTRQLRRKRASVPSWDEIMFGAPTPKKPPQRD